jgi:hypothetical protein
VQPTFELSHLPATIRRIDVGLLDDVSTTIIAGEQNQGVVRETVVV